MAKQLPAVRVPMARAAADLATLCDLIDDGAEPTAALKQVFDETKLDLADAVDRRIMFFSTVEAAIEQARGARAAWDAQVQQLKGLLASMQATTKATIEAFPDLPYQGQLGKLAVQKNGGRASLSLTFGDKDLTPDLIEMFGIDERYYTVRTTYTLLTDAVRKDLDAGRPVPWAQFGERGTHLKVKLAPPTAEAIEGAS